MKFLFTILLSLIFFTANAQDGKEIHCGEHFIRCNPSWNANDSDNRIYSPTLFSDKNPAFYYLCMMNVKGDTVFYTRKYYQGWNGRLNNREEILTDGIYRWKAGYCMPNTTDTFSCDGELNCTGLRNLGPIEVEDTSECAAYVPNAFSPNEDYVNDTWRPYFSCGVFDYTVYLFDRWGNLIWTSTNPDIGWDGTKNGSQPYEMGAYVYKIQYHFSKNDAMRKMVGVVNLIR